MRAPRFWLVVAMLAALGVAPVALGEGHAESAWSCPADRRVADRRPGSPPALCVVADHAHREGVVLVVDALVKNISGRPLTRAEVSVESYTYFGDLLGAEDTVVRPDRLEPGQEGTVLVFTPWQDRIEKLRYLITWRQAGRQYQGSVERGIGHG